MGDSMNLLKDFILETDERSLEYNVNYSEEKPDLRAETDYTEENEGEKIEKSRDNCDDLYAQLDDKNRAIETLKRRLTNQQIQLAYYLHKNLTTETVLEFSSKCFPQLAEDNTQLSLAMYKFIRDTGGKTRLAQLREKLSEYNNRVHKALMRQELLMKQHFNVDEDGIAQLQIEADRSEGSCSNKDFSKISSNMEIDGDGDEDKDGLKYMKKAFKTAQLEISSQLLSVTLQIKKELQKFRICSEKVIKLEEERNSLVDRVFSLPPEQRYGSVQIALVEENRSICGNKTCLTQDPDTTAPSMTSVSTNTPENQDNEKTDQKIIRGALRDMESEAIQLLIMSEKQKSEFIQALEESKMENLQLRERLKEIEDAASDERVFQLQEKCFSIEKEVNEMRLTMEIEQQEKERIIKQMANELRNRDMNEINFQQEIRSLEATILMLRDENENLQRQYESERRYVTDFVNQKTSTDEMYPREEGSQVQSQEVDELTDLVVLQEEQIKDLLTIMSGLGIDSRTRSQYESKTNLSEPEYSNEKTESTEECHVQEKNKMRSSQIESFDSGVFSPKRTEKIMHDKEVEEALEELLDENPNIFFDSASDISNFQEIDEEQRGAVDMPSTFSETPTDMKTEYCESIDNKSEHTARTRSRKRRHFIRDKQPMRSEHGPNKLDSRLKRRQDVATTSLRIETRDKDGKSESMHAVLECSSPVDGLLEMDNASKLHLRLQCTSPQRDYSLLTINENYEESCPFCPDKNISGDHKHKQTSLNSESFTNLHLNREAKLYLTKQLTKLKNQLQMEKTSNTTTMTRKDIINNLNEIYSNLFDDNVTSQSCT